MQPKPLLAFSLLCCCQIALAQNAPVPAEVAIRKEAAPVADNAANLEGLTIAAIDIAGIAQGEQLKNAEIFLTLMKSKGETIRQPDYVDYLIESGKEEIARSQQPFGYYNVRVEASRERKGDQLHVRYQVDLQQPVMIDEVSVSVSGAAQSDPEYQKLLAENPFKKGDVLSHKTYETYKARFVALAGARGYFDGKFERSTVTVNPDTNRAAVQLAYQSGERYTFGDVAFSSVPLDEELLQRFVSFDPGQPYLASDVAALQQDLQGSGYFKQALVGGEPQAGGKTVPVEAQLTMNKNRRYALGVGYSTDTGVRGKADFDWRWVNRKGHTFSSSLYLSKKDSHLDNIYRIPAANPTTDYYYFRFGGLRKDDKYKTTRAFAGGGYNFRDGNWEHRYALEANWEDFTIGEDSDKVLLLTPRAQWTYTSTSNRLNPESGFQGRVEVLGAAEGVLSDVSFVQTNAAARYIHSFDSKNRIVGRLNTGATWTDDFHRLPPSLRYFAGGDRSIRGYAYESIGERDAKGNNIGGRYLAVGSLEYEYYFKDDWAAAAFIDAGDAFVHDFDMKIGAGAGVHWRSPVGPIKLDVGHGFNKDYGDKYRIHLTVGAELDL
ncbi:MAG: outer membrane protein assembly factor [Cardiobacteriaceae bacterium]|nr:outer membrane protein assembly factor [Cardiobacteriaceae bacterium]